MTKLKIRLIIPQCKDWEYEWYCSYCWDVNFRKEILIKAFRNFDGDLVVTPHNFICCCLDELVIDFEFKNFVNQKIISEISDIPNKKNLILGIDFLNPTRNSYNPYEGIDAVVCALFVENEGNFIYKTHIWECWREKGDCNQAGFIAQNRNRCFKLNGFIICLF